MTKVTSASLKELSIGQIGPLVAESGLALAASPAIVPFPKWQRARDRACAALFAGESRLVLTGPAGTGKSTLLQEIARIMRYAGWQVTIRIASWQTEGELTPSGPQSALLIDEADRLSDEAMKQFETTFSGAVVLAGINPIRSRQEATTRISLGALTPTEARAYIAQWMDIVGQDLSLVQPSAIERAIELGSGVPRLLSSLLGGAIWMAAASGTDTVTRQHVEDVAALPPCVLQGGDGTPLEAECQPSAPLAAQHGREPTETEPFGSQTSGRAEASIDADQIHHVPRLHEALLERLATAKPDAELPNRRRWLLPRLAACFALVAAGGGSAVFAWPDQTIDSARLVLASLSGHIFPPKQNQQVASRGAATAIAVPNGHPEPEPKVEAVQLPSAVLVPPGPEARATLALGTPAENVTREAPVAEPAIIVGAVPDLSPGKRTVGPEPKSLHIALPFQQSRAAPVASSGREQIVASPEQREAAQRVVAAATQFNSPSGSDATSGAAAEAQLRQPPSLALPQALVQSDLAAPERLAPPAAPEVQAVAPTPPLEPLAPNPSPAAVAALLARGDALIALGNIAAARLVYQRAAALGSGLAATATGKTYDPRFLRQIGAIGVVADRDAAAAWYRRGAALGDEKAAPFLGGVEAKAGQ